MCMGPYVEAFLFVMGFLATKSAIPCSFALELIKVSLIKYHRDFYLSMSPAPIIFAK